MVISRLPSSLLLSSVSRKGSVLSSATIITYCGMNCVASSCRTTLLLLEKTLLMAHCVGGLKYCFAPHLPYKAVATSEVQYSWRHKAWAVPEKSRPLTYSVSVYKLAEIWVWNCAMQFCQEMYSKNKTPWPPKVTALLRTGLFQTGRSYVLY